MLEFGSLHQKQALITLINQAFQPAFGPILKRALSDDNNAVRVQAATAMNRIENDIHRKTVDLTGRLERNPADPAGLLALARHYDSYLYSRILDVRREAEVREKALDAWNRYLAVRPDDAQARIAANRLMLRSGLCSEAASSLKELMDSGTMTARVRFWYMECLYRLGRYEELRACASAAVGPADETEGDTLSAEARGALEFWAGKAAA